LGVGVGVKVGVIVAVLVKVEDGADVAPRVGVSAGETPVATGDPSVFLQAARTKAKRTVGHRIRGDFRLGIFVFLPLYTLDGMYRIRTGLYREPQAVDRTRLVCERRTINLPNRARIGNAAKIFCFSCTHKGVLKKINL
jgi:hypothetical protein